ncbi:MAG TPA: diacylglycerol kinase family protein, partial [Ktedonobacteraceae bacterium]|nr:diacylglycerol kinase family protein [Ktedonobacteraceae bacterium]
EDHKEHILNSLRAYNIEPEIQYTTPEDPGTGLAQQAAQAGADVVIAAGGDGTLHAIACGLIGTRTTLGIIPMGTMNNIAHSLEIPEDIDEACKIIATGTTGMIDVGMMNEHVFLEVAGVGLEAELFPAAEDIKKTEAFSTVRGIFHGLKTLLAFQPTQFVVSFDGRRTRRFRALQISVCNSPYYGAHLQFAPYAVMDDGFLDVLIYKNFSKLEYILHAISISQGKRVLEARVTHRKVKTLRIRSVTPAEIHVDGVPIGQTPATISIQPGALRVRIAQHVASGPKMSSEEQKQTRLYQKAQHYTAENEKGTLHV